MNDAKLIINQLVSATGGSDVSNVVQQVFIGDYERLRDAYIHPWPVFERVNLDHFVGREWLLAEVDDFLDNHDRGYFVLEAEAGLGKTAFLAWLVKERGYIHHFVELAPGLDGVGRGLKNLAAQLVVVYKLEDYETQGVLPGAATRPDFLSNLLRQVSEKRQNGERIVLVVDALDESSSLYYQNVMGLPEILPKGVYIVVSQRPVSVSLFTDRTTTPRKLLSLMPMQAENQNDIMHFLEDVANRSPINQSLPKMGYTSDQFVGTLLKKSEGVWIYLHFVIHDIEQDEQILFDLNRLPDGLTQYYLLNWRKWRYQDEEKWYEIYLPLLATLAVTQEVISSNRLIDWTGIEVPESYLSRLLNELWRPFLSVETKGQERLYRFIHVSLKDFFEGKVSLKFAEAETHFLEEIFRATWSAHNHVANRYLNAWGGLEDALPGLLEPPIRNLDDGYGLRHVAFHLDKANREFHLP